MVGKYLETIHLGVGESTVLLRTSWEMSVTYSPCADHLWPTSEVVDGKNKVSHVSYVFSGSVRHFHNIALRRKFSNHDDFVVTVRYRS